MPRQYKPPCPRILIKREPYTTGADLIYFFPDNPISDPAFIVAYTRPNGFYECPRVFFEACLSVPPITGRSAADDFNIIVAMKKRSYYIYAERYRNNPTKPIAKQPAKAPALTIADDPTEYFDKPTREELLADDAYDNPPTSEEESYKDQIERLARIKAAENNKPPDLH